MSKEEAMDRRTRRKLAKAKTGAVLIDGTWWLRQYGQWVTADAYIIDEPDESLDGDHESALASVCGEDRG